MCSLESTKLPAVSKVGGNFNKNGESSAVGQATFYTEYMCRRRPGLFGGSMLIPAHQK